MSRIDDMPDEVFKALILAGLGLAVVLSVVLVGPGSTRPKLRTTLHWAICLSAFSFGAGCLFAAIRESDSASHGAIASFGFGVALTTISYATFIVSRSKKAGIVATALAVGTLVAGLVVLGNSGYQEDCGCASPTTSVTGSAQPG